MRLKNLQHFFHATWLGVGLTCSVAHAAEQIRPTRDDAVVEVLPSITRQRPPARFIEGALSQTPLAAAQAARAAIGVARQTGDTRYWGRAQATLRPWWDKPTAPTDLAILQSTVQQGRHEFEPARIVLASALKRDPGNAQGWLNMAALERLTGRYPEALQACSAVQKAGQSLYATACELETRSLQGQHAQARSGFRTLLTEFKQADQRSWIYSLLAESEERAGKDTAALAAYRSSLQVAPDLYTSIAYSDTLLRIGSNALALRVLQPLPLTDAVLLRQATAMRRLGDAGWRALRASLRERQNALDRRGDDPGLHGREQALVALWLDDDPAQALALATGNLALQREPLDWWVALQSASQSHDNAKVQALQQEIRTVGLVDARLPSGLKAAALKGTRP